jgi:type I restriction enzyme M protein
MLWVAPSEKDTATEALEKRLWDAADQLRANSGLNAAHYSTPVLGLIFLSFADVRFTKICAGLEKMASSSRHGSRVDEPAARQTQLGCQNVHQACSPLLPRLMSGQVNLDGGNA